MRDRERKTDDYLLGKMSKKEAEAFEIHAFGCPECLEELRLKEQVVDLIKKERERLIADYGEAKERHGVLARVETLFLHWRKLFIYLAAAVLVLVFLSARFLSKNEMPKVDPANFAESPYLESVMQQTFQTSPQTERRGL